jgi:S1-C subfamily serine protease
VKKSLNFSRLFCALALVFFGSLAIAQTKASNKNDPVEATLQASVAAIFVQDDLTKSRESAGSAYLHDAQGHLITMPNINWAERKSGKSLQALLPNGSTRPVVFVTKDERTKITILKIEPDLTMQPVVVGADQQIVVDLPITQLGRQVDGKGLIQQGKIAAIHHPHDLSKHSGFGSFSGNIDMRSIVVSGAPAVNRDGTVIGVSVMYDSTAPLTAPVAYFMSARVVAQIADELIKKGRIARGSIGVALDLRQNQNLTEVFVSGVALGQPAAVSGMKVNDVLLKINGENIQYPEQVRYIVSGSKTSDVIDFEIKRADKVISLKVLPAISN